MLIYLDETPKKIAPGSWLYALREQNNPDADVLIVNGHPANSDVELHEGDHVVMITRGVQPSAADLEALMMARHTPGVHLKVKGGRVGIAGAGGLGSLVALSLARVGVGQLNIADFDVVEPSNLNRQQYFVDQIGLPKVIALRDNLKRVNPGTHINCFHQKVTPDNITDIFSDVDILVEAFDRADQKAMLTNQFLHNFPHKKLVAASGIAGYGSSNSICTTKISDHFYVCGDGVTAAEPGCGLMAPRVGIAASHQANAVLRLLLDIEPE